MLPASKNALSSRALNAGIFSLVAAIVLALIDGYIRGYLRNQMDATHLTPAVLMMIGEWSYSLRNVAENVIWAAAVVFIGAKFLENRTVLSVGFEKVDSTKMSIKGPDGDNVVWVGHRYGTKLEAESVALALENRMKEDAPS